MQINRDSALHFLANLVNEGRIKEAKNDVMMMGGGMNKKKLSSGSSAGPMGLGPSALGGRGKKKKTRKF